MKNGFRIVGASILTVIYCLVLALTCSAAIPVNHGNDTTDKQTHYLGSNSNSLLSHTSESEKSITDLSNFSSSASNLVNFDIWTTNITLGKLSQAKYTQYTAASINFLIQHQKTSLLFPFNYFW